MEVKKILWATDFSKNAAEALPYVTSLSEKYETEVHVVYVIEDLASWFVEAYKRVKGNRGGAGVDGQSLEEYGQTYIDELHEWEEKKAKERLDEICSKYLKSCPLYTKHVAIGDPAEEILKLIEEENVDMVVVATRGRKGHFPLGSVAEKVVKNSPVPVVTIPIAAEQY